MRTLWTAHVDGSDWDNEICDNTLTHLLDDPSTSIATHGYDEGGNLRNEGLNRQLQWNAAGQLSAYATQVPLAEPSVYALYLYDASGQRLKKLVRYQGGNRVDTTVYLGGVFEYHKRIDGATTTANNHIHLMDGSQRLATIRLGAAFPDDGGPAIQYHLSDIHNTSQITLDETGNWCNREEYSPFGESVFGGFAKKRYRFTGKERDEESGFSYHGARYYAAWLCRWASADPAGLADGLNRYAYARGSPIRLMDGSGLSSEEGSTNPSEPSWVDTGLTAVSEFEDASGNLLTRTLGVVTAAGGAAEMTLGGTLFAAPEPTMISKVLGTALIVNGADQVSTGLRQAYTGNFEQSIGHLTVSSAAEGLGASPEMAASLADGAELGFGFGAPAAAGKIIGNWVSSISKVGSIAGDGADLAADGADLAVDVVKVGGQKGRSASKALVRGAPELGGFAKGVTPNEIADINRSFGGSVELGGSIDAVLASASFYDGFYPKAAVLVRGIAHGHLYDNGNKRTANAVLDLLRSRNGVTTGASASETRRIINQVAKGELSEIDDIATALRGF